MMPEQRFTALRELEKKISEELIRVNEKVKAAEAKKKLISKDLEALGIKSENQTEEYLEKEVQKRRRELEQLMDEQEAILSDLQEQLNELAVLTEEQ